MLEEPSSEPVRYGFWGVYLKLLHFRTYFLLAILPFAVAVSWGQPVFPTTAPPRFTSKAFLTWSAKYVEDSITSVGFARTTVKYFSPDGNDTTGNGSLGNPWKTLAKASSFLNGTSGDVRLRFRSGGVWRENTGLVINRPQVTVDSYRLATDPKSSAKPVFTRFAAPLEPTAWTATSHADTYVATVTDPVSWVKYWNDEETVLRRMTTVEDCYATPGSWFSNSGSLYVHSVADNDLTTGVVRVEYVPLNTLSGITVADVANVRIHDLRIEGYGAGVPGDHSYNGYAVESNASSTNRTVVTECECYYNGRHSVAKVGSATGGSLVVARCRLGWLVNDDICLVSFAPFGGNELVSAYNEFLGGQLPNSLVPYPNGAPEAPNYVHTSNDSLFKCGLLLCLGNKLVQGPFMCGNISFTTCAPVFSDPANCRAFVIGETAVPRKPNVFDATKPTLTNGNGRIFHRLGSAWTTYVSCTIAPTLLWTSGSGDVECCSTSEGTWINSEITFDFRNVDLSSWDRVLSVSAVQPGFFLFTSSFYGCRITFRSRPGSVVGFSGPMLHKYGSFYKSIDASWIGEMRGSIVAATSIGGGQFQLGFGNLASKLTGNAYYGLTEENGPWGCDQDAARVTGTLFTGVPRADQNLALSGPILISGYALQYDRYGSTRAGNPTVGPLEPGSSGVKYPGIGGPSP